MLSEQVFISSNYIVIDTETTGLPKRVNGKFTCPKNNISDYDTARVIEIGYIIFDRSHNNIFQRSLLINNGIDIPEASTKIHGITREMIEKDGIATDIAFDILSKDLLRFSPETIIAHNIDFDYNVILSECYRGNYLQLVDIFQKMKQICTMRLGTIPPAKYISLKNLCDILKVVYKNAHRAFDDAIMCFECFQKIIKSNNK